MSVGNGRLRWHHEGDSKYYLLSGACPRCGHDTEQEVLTEWVADGVDVIGAEPTTDLEGDPEAAVGGEPLGADVVHRFGTFGRHGHQEISFNFDCACGKTHSDGSRDHHDCGWVGRSESARPHRAESTVAEPHAQNDAEESYWRQQVIDGQRKQLDTVRAAATSWTQLLAALLGIFGTVAFAGGLTGLDDLDDSLHLLVKAVTLAAVVCLLLATILAGCASGSGARSTSQGDWSVERDRVVERAGKARTQLIIARYFGVGALVLVLVGSTTIVVAGKADTPAKKPPMVVAIVDGKAVCGKLVRGADGELTAGGTPLRVLTAVTVVDACP